MERPYKYFIYDTLNPKRSYHTNIEPLIYELCTYVPTDKPNTFVNKQTKICYIDTRYDAKLRLFKYLYPELNRAYKPFGNPEIGRSLPILNF